MIKVGIIGAEKPEAGELLRILINNTAVAITTLYSPSYNGRQVSSCHHGFLGESIVEFSDKIDPSELDTVFIADESEIGENVMRMSEDYPDLRIIDMSAPRFEHMDAHGMEYGLSEANRKSLVRGARLAVVPSPAAAVALTALNPLALAGMIESDIDIDIALPHQAANAVDIQSLSKEIKFMLSKSHPDFDSQLRINIIPSDIGRAIRVRMLLRSPLATDEVDRVFESVYDDHSFVATSHSDIGNREVEGTNKCVVTINKPGAGLLELQGIGDVYLRGGAATAAHIMNLFFALDEKVGLKLKNSCFGMEDSHSDSQFSWFA